MKKTIFLKKTDGCNMELGKYISGTSLEIMTYEDKVDIAYSNDSNLNNIIIYFSLFAIIIALIGIFGQSDAV